MSAPVLEYGKPVNFTATGNVTTSEKGVLIGFYVNSTTAGTLVFRSGGASGTVMDGTITPAVGFHRFPAAFTNGLHVTVGGTIDATAFVVEGQN